MITAEFLREILTYDPLTGAWTWQFRADRNKQWNARFGGKIAGSIDPDTGYWRIRIDDFLYYSHRLAFLYILGVWPANEVDHKNLDRADCSWDNLREATHSENGRNKKPRSVSGYKGVSIDKRNNRWTAEIIGPSGKIRKAGFETALEAHHWYVEQAEKHHGEFARAK